MKMWELLGKAKTDVVASTISSSSVTSTATDGATVAHDV
jgi:hypothetical protein